MVSSGLWQQQSGGKHSDVEKVREWGAVLPGNSKKNLGNHDVSVKQSS